MASAAPSKQLVPNEFILSLYDDCDAEMFRCTYCGKNEPDDTEFSECSRCMAASYCSRDCQVKHWKQHKIRCKKFSDEQKQAYGKIPGRVRRFDAYYAPIVSKILAIQMALLKLENENANPTTHFVMLPMSELPQDASRPRLKIAKAEAMPMSDLPAQYRQHIEFGLSQYPPGTYVIPYIWGVTFPGGEILRPGMTAYEVNPILDPMENLPRDRAALEALGAFWMNILNDCAEGRRPDLFSAIKRKIKAQRRS
eukprot:scaffold613_cov140-Skeletonema_dohrnii-CCMP3373.AAC.2